MTTSATDAGAGTPATLPADWLAYISPFAQAVGLTVEEVTERLKRVVDEPGADAISLLQAESDSPLALIREAFPGVATAKLNKAVAALRKAPDVAATQPVIATTYNSLPEVPSDDMWLKMLQTGGILKVSKATVLAAVKAGLANRIGLFDLPATLQRLMEETAEALEEPAGNEYYEVRKLLTQKKYADIFAAIEGQEGVDGRFVTEGRKQKLLSRVDELLWPALTDFQAQLQGWVQNWTQTASNPALMFGAIAAIAGGGSAAGAMPPGMMAPPPTDAIRDSATGVIDKVNRIFAGTGAPIASALGYEAMRIRGVLETPNLPALIGVPNREQMLKKCGVAVSADIVRLERSLQQYVLAVMELPDVTGPQELAFVSALSQLGAQIPWDSVISGGSKRSNRPFRGSREE